jgi:aminoglycoside phosphotransferase (APT) family kinase protein
MRNWQPDVELDERIAHAIVSHQFSEFENQPRTFLGRGWDNFCIEYPNGVVFRLPTRKMGAELLLAEMAALPALGHLVPLPVPVPTFVGEPTGDYPYPFIGYPKLAGNPADQLEWTAAARCKAAPLLGAFLKALHQIDCKATPFNLVPGDETAKANPPLLLKRIRQRNEQIRAVPYAQSNLLEVSLQTAEALAVQPVMPTRTCLVHGDLYPRHILADDTLTITGVIDWGDMHRGDPDIDLSIAYSFLNKEERPAFWAAYGREGSNTQIMVLRAAMYGFSLIAYGLDEKDAPATAMGEQILRRIDPIP